MKSKLHVAIGEYEFLEVEFEGTSEDAEKLYREVKQTFHIDKEGHNQREWARVRNTFCNTGELNESDWSKCSKYQKAVINEIKLCIKANE